MKRRTHSIAEDFHAYDQLPRWLRLRIQQGSRRLSAVTCLEILVAYRASGWSERQIPQRMLKSIDEREQVEIRAFAERCWPGPGPYPHLAAAATVLR